MDKVDFKVTLKEYYAARPRTFSQVVVPEFTYLMVDGSGDPNTSPQYSTAIEALYTLSYTLKFMSKGELSRDYTVPPLEGLWWSNDMADFEKGNRTAWLWSAMIMLPEWITPALFREGVAVAAKRKPECDLSRVRSEALNEGLSVQTLFIGPYRDEAPVISELHTSYLPANDLVENGKHHEIYLSDPRRTDPAKLRTIIRQPVARSSLTAIS